MVYCSLKDDIYFNSDYSAVTYSIRDWSDTPIYYGRSLRSSKTGLNRINVTQIVREYLSNHLEDNWPTLSDEESYVYQQPEAYHIFTVLTSEFEYENYAILYDWIEDFDGNDKVLSEPVSGKLDPRMKMFFTRFGKSDADFNYELGYNTFNIIFSEGTNFDFQQQQRTLFLEDCTNWGVVSAETTSDWFSVAKNIYGYSSLTIYVEENSGSTQREGTFSLCWPGKYFEPQCNVYDVVQDREHLEITFSGDTNYDYASGTSIISFTANTEITAVTIPTWATNVTISQNQITPVGEYTVAGTITITYGLNTGSVERSGDIVVRRINCPFGETRSLTLTQSSFYFEFVDPSQAVINISSAATVITIDVITNAPSIELQTTSNWVVGSYSNNRITLNILTYTGADYRIGVVNIYAAQIDNPVGTITIEQEGSEVQGEPFTIKALTNGHINIDYDKSTYSMSYDVNDTGWLIDGYSGDLSNGLDVNEGDTVKLAGTIKNAFGPILEFTGDVELYGNILSLEYSLYFADYSASTVVYSTINHSLWRNNTTRNRIISTRGLCLADSVVTFAYDGLFGDCVNMVSAPAKMPKVLKDYSCRRMFSGCTSLVNAPDLPATTLSVGCYQSMFYGCTSLVNAPSLPVTVLTDGCYSRMFYGCTSLVNAPSLPATALTNNCYYGMFEGCTSLVNAPDLPATTLANECYTEMFSGCTSLVNAPSLPATALTRYCYSRMFDGCASLVNAPDLPATTLAYTCYWGMFYGCTSLVNAPSLPATTLAVGCYSRMFYGCTSLVNAPSLPATALTNACYQRMFNACTSLETAPDLPATTLANECYYAMFYGCTSLVNAPASLPAYFLDEYCYESMFEGCTNLEIAPDLPARIIVNDAYYRMFYGCTKLRYIKCLATDNVDVATEQWVYGVSATGTFVKKTGVSWYQGNNGIPYDWTIEEADS